MFLIIMVSFIAGICGFLTTVPENAAVIEGATVIMKCQTNDTSKQIFWRAPDSKNLSNKIFSGGKISENWSEVLSLNNSLPGQYDLVINTTLSSGTQYVCQEGAFGHLNDSYGTAELIVLAADPKCEVNMEIEDMTVKVIGTNFSIEMQCTVKYSGNWAPLMDWRQEGFQDPMTAGVDTTVQHDAVISTLTVSANITSKFTRYICTTRFEKSHMPSSTTAENVPTYSYNWTSPTVVTMNENPVTTYSHSSTTTSSPLKQIVILVAVIKGVLLAVLFLLLIKRIVIKKKPQSSNHDMHATREADILQHRLKTPEPVLDISVLSTLYAAVNKPEKAQADQLLIPGGDGIEYAKLSQLNSPIQQAPRENLFNTSIYAKIDHTISAHPPPPKFLL